MADIFISYAREDVAWVEKLTNALESHGYSVWWDRNLSTGARYPKEIEAQLREAGTTIVIWSKVSIESSWVADEAALARDLGCLAPISKDGSVPPLGFGQYQATDFSRWNGGHGEPLSTLLQAIAARTQRTEPPAPKLAKTGPDRRRLMAAGVAIALLVAVFGVWGTGLFRPRQLSGHSSVAVLAFTDHSQAGDQAHLANGMTAELLSRLRGIKNLTVAGGDWMPDLMKQLGGDPKALGDKLSVANILDGDVRSDGDSLRITARLTSATDGHLIWTQSYNRANSGVFAIQDEIASQVANALSVTLDVGLQSTAYGGTRNFEAYDHFLRGRALRNVPPPKRAIDELEQAVAIDPAYARAWSELAIAYGTLVRVALTLDAMQPPLQKMDAASAKAEALAPNMWFGRTPRAWYYVARNEWTKADEAHRAALMLGDVADPDLYTTIMAFSGQVGRCSQARGMAEQVRAIDPRFPDLLMLVLQSAFPCGDEAAARAAYAASRAEAPALSPLRELYALWFALGAKDMVQARKVLKDLERANPWYGKLAEKVDSPGQMLAEMKAVADGPTPGRGRLATAAVLAGAYGDPQLAVRLLRQAYLGPGWAGQFYIWLPPLATARKTEAFKRFVEDVGFVAMWRKSGEWGDFCKPLNDHDFECV